MSLKPVRKILHIHSGKDGGAERFFVNLANAFGEYGLKQKFVIRPKRSWRREIVDLGQIFEDASRCSNEVISKAGLPKMCPTHGIEE